MRQTRAALISTSAVSPEFISFMSPIFISPFAKLDDKSQPQSESRSYLVRIGSAKAVKRRDMNLQATLAEVLWACIKYMHIGKSCQQR